MPLLTCPGCARHVRANEAACPFCQAPTQSTWRLAGLGTTVAAASLLSACMVLFPPATPVYGVPAPPFSPSPSPSPSASPELPPE